jgi:hypothetical protein
LTIVRGIFRLIFGITLVILWIMKTAKTAISVPIEIFELSERLAKKLKVSRSKIFAMGVKKLGEEYEEDEVTANLNKYYENERAEIDPVIMKMAALSLPKEEW